MAENSVNVGVINCTTKAKVSHQDFTNHILTPYLNWLNQNPTKHPQYLILFPDLPTRIWGNVTNALTVSNSVAFALHTNTSGINPFVTSLNMGLDVYLGPSTLTNDCIAYINKLRDFGTNYSPGQLFISVSKGGYANTNFVLDNLRHGPGYPFPEFDRSGDGGIIASVTNTILNAGTAGLHVTYNDQIETNNQPTPPHITNAVNVAGYICWGSHSSLGNEYAIRTNILSWTGDSGWWVIETIESFNGWRHPGQGNFTQWFSPNAFGGTNYSNTPVGAVTHTDEPGLPGVNNTQIYFGAWATGKSFAICAWGSRVTPKFQAVGDPFVRR